MCIELNSSRDFYMKKLIAFVSFCYVSLFSEQGFASCNQINPDEACIQENLKVRKSQFAECLHRTMQPLIHRSQGADVAGPGGFDACADMAFGEVDYDSMDKDDEEKADVNPSYEKAVDQYKKEIHMLIDPVEERIIELHAKIIQRYKTKWEEPRSKTDVEYLSNAFGNYITALSLAIVDFERLKIADEIKQQYIADMQRIVPISIAMTADNYKNLISSDNTQASSNAEILLRRDLSLTADAYRRIYQNGVPGSDVMLEKAKELENSIYL